MPRTRPRRRARPGCAPGEYYVPDDYLTAADLVGLGIDPALVRVLCPWAPELTALDGSRCWAVADLDALLGGAA
jgi:hypothetical protein